MYIFGCATIIYIYIYIYISDDTAHVPMWGSNHLVPVVDFLFVDFLLLFRFKQEVKKVSACITFKYFQYCIHNIIIPFADV